MSFRNRSGSTMIAAAVAVTGGSPEGFRTQHDWRLEAGPHGSDDAEENHA